MESSDDDDDVWDLLLLRDLRRQSGIQCLRYFLPCLVLSTSIAVICTSVVVQTRIVFNFLTKPNVKFNIVSHS